MRRFNKLLSQLFLFLLLVSFFQLQNTESNAQVKDFSKLKPAFATSQIGDEIQIDLVQNIDLKEDGSLKNPAVMSNLSANSNTVEVRLTAAPDHASLLPGTQTDVYAYNGTIPGPTLEAREGDRVIVHFINNLPEETTVHWHGIHLPFVADGSPFHPVEAGEEYVYEFTVLPGMAGTYWYHPHPHHRTAWQVGKGLFGAIIIHPKENPVPEDITDKLLILSDNRFLPDGTLDFPDPDSRRGRIDEMNGREGNVLFVNDKIMPKIEIRSGETQRWRVINASGARIYRLALQGHTFLHIGSDGGLFENPVETDEILLSNGERAELLVRGTGSPGSISLLQTLPYDRYMTHTRPDNWDTTLGLLVVQYTEESPLTPIELPETFRKVPALDPDDVTATRLMLMSQGKINSKTMDLNRVDEVAELGATEIWEIENLVGMDHPFHLHGFQFQVIDRNGVPELQPKWKDTVNVPKFGKARFIVRYENYRGKWMYHCHILDHEDAGMMGVLEVK